MPVKKAILGLQSPVAPKNKKYPSSQRASTGLIQALMGEIEFSIANHPQALMEERRDGQKIRNDANDAKLGKLVDNLDAPERQLILHAKHMGYWMTMLYNTVTNTVLAAT